LWSDVLDGSRTVHALNQNGPKVVGRRLFCYKHMIW